MPVNSERLRAAGLRVTQPRLAVLATVRDRPHLDADAIDPSDAPGPCLDPEVTAIAVDHTQVTHWGRCPDCQSQDRSGTPHHLSGGER
ncbi:hypothetical protein [Micromonospora cremea]|uniref:Fur family transcriptional regulator, ferric uptake regulator n=1 Tax=Micromonospora cremea TaxID=709881 RepID=A0A1N5Z4A4_9ACTN|nr:hypothetical protein [Micromonospora cremea]SIN16719.1 hypothetical protein SAMN04489832_3618 [Micromonospora cremea]